MDGYVREYRSSALCTLEANGEDFSSSRARPVAGLGGRKNYAKSIKASDVGRLHISLCGMAVRSRYVPGLHQQHQQCDLYSSMTMARALSCCSAVFYIVPSTWSGRRLAAKQRMTRGQALRTETQRSQCQGVPNQFYFNNICAHCTSCANLAGEFN
jgi:hypothetical protein